MNNERLQQLLKMPLSEIKANSELQAELIQFYKEVYNVKICSSCKNKIEKYYNQLQQDNLEKTEAKQDSNFKLRTDIGVLQINFEHGQYISQSHAEDEVCIAFLKANPNRISLFEIYPENWVELINKNNEQENENE